MIAINLEAVRTDHCVTYGRSLIADAKVANRHAGVSPFLLPPIHTGYDQLDHRPYGHPHEVLTFSLGLRYHQKSREWRDDDSWIRVKE